METLTKPKQNAYSAVTDWLIEKLEQGTIPWRHSWVESGLPQNLVTRQPYREINTWLLASYGYAKSYFLTAPQVTELGGVIKRHEKAHVVFLAESILPSDNAYNSFQEKYLTLSYELVYNISQCRGIPNSEIPTIRRKVNPLFACEEIVRHMPCKPEFRHQEQKAFYHPLFDFINMPVIESYADVLSYYSSLFYELIHCTGHVSRLNRLELLDMKPYGPEAYSVEELISDIGASYLKSYCGITNNEFRFNGAYREGWLEKLSNNPNLIFYASMHAQKAVEYILNITDEEIS